jgi:hypothetical protein
MRQVAKLIMVAFALAGFGTAFANEEAEAIKAECMAQAEEQGVEDVQGFVAQCVKDRTAQ